MYVPFVLLKNFKIISVILQITPVLFQLGSPRGKVVVGTIYRIVGDDLYVDFDWKFPCVVKRPTENAQYVLYLSVS